MRRISTLSNICPAAIMLLIAAGLIHATTLSDMATTADAIVLGTVSTRTEGPSSVVFDINVEKVLKGDLTSRVVHVSHQWSRGGGIHIGHSPIIQAQLHGMWSLQRTNTTDWEVLGVKSPDGTMAGLFWAAPAILPTFYESLANSSVLDTLVFEVAAGIELEGFHPEDMIGATGSVNAPALQAVFAHFLDLPTPAFRSAGLAGMLTGGQKGAITRLVQVWPTISTDPSRSHVLSALRDFFRDPTPTFVQQLAEFANLNPTSTELRRASVWALSAIHSKDSLPFLASLLHSSDPVEQARGVFGLSSFRMGVLRRLAIMWCLWSIFGLRIQAPTGLMKQRQISPLVEAILSQVIPCYLDSSCFGLIGGIRTRRL
jgi:hypothetical protein